MVGPGPRPAPHDIGLLAATTALLTHEDTHPALRQRFAQAAQQIHGGSGWFNGARDFPNARTSELPVSPEGDRAINGTPPFWQRYLPFWASNLLERMWLVIGGLIVLLLPLSRVVPRSTPTACANACSAGMRACRLWKPRMNEDDAEPSELLNELDELDRVASQIAVPLAHADELYALRSNIEKTRRRLLTHEKAARHRLDNSYDRQQHPLMSTKHHELCSVLNHEALHRRACCAGTTATLSLDTRLN